MTTLVAIGCSHTHGSMIDGINGSTEENISKTFSAKIAQRYNFKYHNLGLGGGSNAYIYRATTKFINEQMKPDEDYLFLIGWTSPNRQELRYPDNSHYSYNTLCEFIDDKYMPYSYGTADHLFLSSEAKGIMKNQDLLFFDEILLDNWATYALVLQHLFKRKNIKYLQFNTCHEIYPTPTNTSILEKIDTKHYIDPLAREKSFVYWSLDKNFEMTPCWHFGEDAHHSWSLFLEKHLIKLGYL